MHWHHELSQTANSVSLSQFHVNPHQALHRAEATQAHRLQRRALLAQKRFRQLYHLRNLLFRFSPGLANRLAL